MALPLQTTIIFNPNSTGDGRKNAEELRDKLVSANGNVELIETEHAGHAEEIARQIADNNQSAYIVSSSGDGGYHEVINGILSSNNPKVIAGVLPSGNANDHYNFVHRGDVVQRVIAEDIDEVDVLKVETPEWTRYAHSYVGLGVTPQIGEVLTKNTLNPLKESWLVATHLFKVHPVKILVDGHVRRYDHLVFSIIGKMSKYLTLDENASVTDGLFEETAKRHGTVIELLRHFFQAVATSSSDVQKTERRELTILRATTIQLDGEVYNLAKGDKVVVSCVKKIVRCII
jgi:diacylglycerol kinase family enzyme